MNDTVFLNPYIVIDYPGYDRNHINDIIDLTDKGMGVRQLFLYWALQARRLDYKKQPRLEPSIELHSRAASSVGVTSRSSGPNTGSNS